MDKIIKHNIIIVDDETATREALCNYFPWNDLGFQIIGQFDNGKLAYDFIRNNQVHVVFSDIRMPIMDGLKLAQKIYEANMPVKVIFLSGYADFSYAKQALIYGVKDYILKPAKYNELIEVFKRIKHELERSDANRRQTEPMKQPIKAMDFNYDEEVITVITNYLENNYCSANLKEASTLVHMNPNYLSYFFKQKTGRNFSEYLYAIRMLKSSELLFDVKKRIYEISREIGFSNSKNFSRSFKKYFGLTPEDFRKGMQNEK